MLPHGRLQVVVLRIDVGAKLRRPYVRVSLGEAAFQTSVAERASAVVWNEGFEFNVTHHEQLFGVVQVDLYDMQWLFPDRHVGRTEIRLRSLETFPDVFTSYYELWEKRLSGLEVNLPGVKPVIIGAIQLTIKFKRDEIPAVVGLVKAASMPLDAKASHISATEPSDGSDDEYSEFYRHLEEALVPSQELTLTRTEAASIKRTATSSSSPSSSDSARPPTESTSLLLTIGRLALSTESQQALRGIARMATAFGQGFELGNADILAGVGVLDEFYRRVESTYPGTAVVDLAKVEKLVHFYKFAFASYGWKGLNFFGKGNGYIRDSFRRRSDELSIREYLVLQEHDLVAYDIHGTEIFKPSYYVARDRLTNSMVLAIRGTMSAVDTITDLVCDYEKWQNGLIHSGMATSARGLLETVIPNVIVQCQRDAIDSLIIVGHSLGAGTAAILTMMIQECRGRLGLLGVQLRVHCYAFGPPCVVSLDLAEKYRDCIDAVVLGEDVACRLSYGSMMDLRSMLLAAAGLADSNLLEVLAYSGVQAAKASEERWENRVRVLTSLRDRLRVGNSHRYPKLFIPGSVHHITSDGSKSAQPASESVQPAESSAAKNKPAVKRTGTLCKTEQFVEIKLVDGMLLDHLPGAYDRALTQLRHSLMTSGTSPTVVDSSDRAASTSSTNGAIVVIIDRDLPPLPACNT